MDDMLQDEEILIRFLDGELSETEAAKLKNRLQQEPALQARLTDLEVATQAIKQYGTAQQVKTVHGEMMKELKAHSQPAKMVSMRRVIRFTMAIAASLLILFIGIRLFLSSQTSPQALYNDAFVDFQVSPSRGTASGFSAIEKSYQEKNYNAVVQSVRSTGLDPKDSLLVGLSYLQTEKPSQAIGIFQRLSTSENEFRQDAEFYLALAYLKSKQVEKALPIVEKINGNSSHLYHERFDQDFTENLREMSSN